MPRSDLLLPKLFLAMVLLSPASGLGEEPAGEPGEEPCAADVEKFCSQVRPGGGRVAACLQAHEAELTGACKQEFAAAREKAEAVKNACKADAGKFCKGVKPGKGRILACLKSHHAELSQECRGEMEK